MKRKPTPYERARGAFRRAHLYPFRSGEFGHMRWIDGWLFGYAAGKRTRRAASVRGERQ